MSFLLEFGIPELLIVLLILWIFYGLGRTGKTPVGKNRGNRTLRKGMSGPNDIEDGNNKEDA